MTKRTGRMAWLWLLLSVGPYACGAADSLQLPVTVQPGDDLQAVLQDHTYVYLSPGDYALKSLQIPVQRHVVAAPGARIICEGDLRIGADSRIEGLTVQDGRVIIGDDCHLTDCTSVEASRQRSDLQETERNGFMVMGDHVTLERCVAIRASYAGINLRGSADVIGCRVYGFSEKGLSVNHNGKPVDQVVIRDFYCEKAVIAIQLDTRTFPLHQAHLSAIQIGPSPDSNAPIKLATCDQVVIDDLYAPYFSHYGLILAEGLGRVIVLNSTIRDGVTQFPEPGREGQNVADVVVRNTQFGPTARSYIWSHLQIDRLLLDNVTFPDDAKMQIKHLGSVTLRDVAGLREPPQPTQ